MLAIIGLSDPANQRDEGERRDREVVSEQTVIRTIDLPYGQDYAWYPDLNVVALGSHLDCAGREQAILDLQAGWRREHLRLIEPA